MAWGPLGWRAALLSEIAAFPRALLAHRYPNIPLHGDFTQITEEELRVLRDGGADLLCGGTPCQAFSVAGLRAGLDDPRGNLTLAFLGVVDRMRPRWVVWENVPGVLSVGGGRAFGAFLGGLAQLGYGWAYRVLDAQYFGVPQRRRRVFVVGYLGDPRPAQAVLFERESLSGHPPPRRKAWQGVAAGTLRSTDGGGDVDHGRAGHLQPVLPGAGTAPLRAGQAAGTLDVVGALTADGAQDATGGHLTSGYVYPTLSARDAEAVDGRLAEQDGALVVMAHGQANAEVREDGGAPALTCIHEAPVLAFKPAHYTRGKAGHRVEVESLVAEVAPTIGASGAGFARTGNARTEAEALVVTQDSCPVVMEGQNPALKIGTGLEMGQPPAVLCFDPVNITSPGNRSNPRPGDPASTLHTGAAHAVAYTTKLHNTQSNQAGKLYEEYTPGLDHNSPPPALLTPMAVRRLTPLECERLQGFPDGYTLIPGTYRLRRKQDLIETVAYLRGWGYSPEEAAALAHAPDGPRYHALGNSWAVPVVRWVGERIDMVDALLTSLGGDTR